MESNDVIDLIMQRSDFLRATAFNVNGRGRVVIDFAGTLPVNTKRLQLVSALVQHAIKTRRLTARALGVSPRLHRQVLAELERKGLIEWPRARGVQAHWRTNKHA
jgi:hypothetical protein